MNLHGSLLRMLLIYYRGQINIRMYSVIFFNVCLDFLFPCIIHLKLLINVSYNIC